MTDFAGGIFGIDLFLARSSPLHANDPGSWDGSTRYMDMGPQEGGAKSENRPVPITTARDLTGKIAASYFDDYYNRIWIIPSVANLGAVTADTTFPFYIWNAYLVSVTESGIVAVGSLDQITIAGPVDPYTFAPLKLQAYTLNVSGKGAATINGHFDFEFSTGDVTTLTVKGSRAFLWAYDFWPNWRDVVSIGYEFKTEIITSRKGYEQRRALRQTPRKSIEFTSTLLDADKKRKFRRLMQTGQSLTFIMPEFPRRTKLAAAAAAGDNSIVLASVPDWLVLNSQIVLANYGTAEVTQVQNITGTTIGLATNLAHDFPNGAAVIAGVVGRLDDKLSGKVLTSFASELHVTFKAYPGEEGPSAYSAGAAGVVFDGREIMTWRPNWIRDPSQDMIWPVEEVDAGIGQTARFPVIPFPSGIFKASFLNLTLAEQEAMRQFHQRAMGSFKEFFVPTFENDLGDLREIAHSGANIIRIIGTEVYAMAHTSLIHKAVIVRMNDGTIHAYKVQSVVEVSDVKGNDTLIEFTVNTTVDIGGPDTSSVDWLFLSRFATDSMSFGYETIDISQTEMAFQILPYAEAE